jgi:polyphosphate glucokinase
MVWSRHWVGASAIQNGKTYEERRQSGARTHRKRKWRRNVEDVTNRLRAALEAGRLVIGGGNAKLLETLPTGA